MEPAAQKAHASSITILHIGAWCGEVPRSTYATSLQITNSSIDRRTAEVGHESFKNPAREHLDNKHTARSPSNEINHEPQACFQLQHPHPQVPKSNSGYLTPMQRWLRETAREAPWQAIEVAPEVLGAENEAAFGTYHNNRVSEPEAVYGGSILAISALGYRGS
jgi:hypothetical protein